MLESVLSGIEVRVLTLFVVFEFLKKILLLLLGELLAVDTFVLLFQLCDLLLVLCALLGFYDA